MFFKHFLCLFYFAILQKNCEDNPCKSETRKQGIYCTEFVAELTSSCNAFRNIILYIYVTINPVPSA